MRMSHIYQPLMVQFLLEHESGASARDVAAVILTHDESQLDYYEQIVNRMPGPVLRRRGIVVREAAGYALHPDLRSLSQDERADLIGRCHAAVDQFKQRRGEAIWQHRAVASGVIPGGVRYDTLKRAGFRCELCGIAADERALDVDHIRPRSLGGVDDPENLQALCWQCNANKGDGDDTDFRGVRDLYGAREHGCQFCYVGSDRIVAETPLALLIRDRFPVADGHLLALSRRHVADYFSLYAPERNALHQLLDAGRTRIREEYPDVAGFNVGINAGEAAGQTIFHCHVHLIPRRVGDVDQPRGGVRGVIPGRRGYPSD
jgi:diadenosine tetraphosphate (Ap4A) HIT family hydrolase/5-methylcytosine-specific restriction endonuclease McrA